MTTLREAAQQALEALEYYRSGEDYQPTPASDAITALREALEQPEPEPVAWMDRDGDIYPMPETEGWRPPHTLLYTHPPQHQEANPVVWQFRMRPDWVLDKDFWEPWTNCTKEQAADYQRVPHLHGWTYEVRLLFTHPPQRKPLTDEEIIKIWNDMGNDPIAPSVFSFIACVRKTEQAHGIA